MKDRFDPESWRNLPDGERPTRFDLVACGLLLGTFPAKSIPPFALELLDVHAGDVVLTELATESAPSLAEHGVRLLGWLREQALAPKRPLEAARLMSAFHAKHILASAEPLMPHDELFAIDACWQLLIGQTPFPRAAIIPEPIRDLWSAREGWHSQLYATLGRYATPEEFDRHARPVITRLLKEVIDECT